MVNSPLESAVDIVAGYVRCGQQLRVTRGDSWPTPGSLGEVERQDQSRFDGRWTQPPVEAAVSLAYLYLVAAEDHLLGLARAAGPPHLAATPSTVARGMLEAAARCWWLLDPQASVEERIGRGLNARLHGLRERAKGDPEFREQRDRQCAALISGAVQAGMTLTNHGDWVIKGWPSNTDLVDQLIDTLPKEGGGSVYRYYTAIAHSELGGLVTLLVADPTHPTGGSLLLADEDMLTILVACAFAYEAVTDRVFAYLGWDTTTWLSWKRHARKTLAEVEVSLLRSPTTP